MLLVDCRCDNCWSCGTWKLPTCNIWGFTWSATTQMSGIKIMRRVAGDFLLWEVIKIMVPNKWCTRSNFWGLAKGSLTGVTIFGCSVRKLARNYLVGLKYLYPRQEAAVVKLVLRDHNSGQQQICRRLEAHCQAHKRQAEENCAGALNRWQALDGY